MLFSSTKDIFVMPDELETFSNSDIVIPVVRQEFMPRKIENCFGGLRHLGSGLAWVTVSLVRGPVSRP